LASFYLLEGVGDLDGWGSLCGFTGVEFICDPAFMILVLTGVDALAMFKRGWMREVVFPAGG
jgi:hypothetical protein